MGKLTIQSLSSGVSAITKRAIVTNRNHLILNSAHTEQDRTHCQRRRNQCRENWRLSPLVCKVLELLIQIISSKGCVGVMHACVHVSTGLWVYIWEHLCLCIHIHKDARGRFMFFLACVLLLYLLEQRLS